MRLLQISFVCLICGATADLNPRSHCIHSALTPALYQRQPSLLAVSEMHLCLELNLFMYYSLSLLKKKQQNLPQILFALLFISSSLQSICIITSPPVTVSLCFFFFRFWSSTITTCTELRSFVCLRLCHCLAGVSPQSPVWGSECDSLGGNCFTASLSPRLSQHSNKIQKGTVL